MVKRFIVVLAFLLMGASASAQGQGQDQGPINPKLNAYIKAYNLFIGTFGFTDQYKAYQRSNVSQAKPSSNFWVREGWIDKGVDMLKAANPDSAPGELNVAATALLASMDKVLTHLTSLRPYYESKKYLDDNLARGKAEDAAMLAEFKAAEDDLTRFHVLLDREIDRRDLVSLEELKSEGQLEQYHVSSAVFHAKRLLKLIRMTANAKDPALYTQADAEVATIEKALADAREEHAKGSEFSQFEGASIYFNGLLGAYRELKIAGQKGDAQTMGSRFQLMVNSYNGVIQTLNGSPF